MSALAQPLITALFIAVIMFSAGFGAGTLWLNRREIWAILRGHDKRD